MSYILYLNSLNFMRFCNRVGKFSPLKLRLAYNVRSKNAFKMSFIMLPEIKNARKKRNILIMDDFENEPFPTYSICNCAMHFHLECLTLEFRYK